jgi:hypothetical protein
MKFAGKVLVTILLLLPVLLFYSFTAYYTVDVGWTDDWHCVEAFMVAWKTHLGTGERLNLLISQMNEHRVLYVRLFTLLVYGVLGRIDHGVLTFIGSLHLLIIPIVFWKTLMKNGFGKAFMIPVILIIFSIQPYENNFWVITSLQHSVAIIFSVWAFYLVAFTQKSSYSYFAVSLLVMAMFTNGNGMFGFIAVLPVVFIERTKKEKIVWGIVTILCFAGYFYDFRMPSHKPSVSANITEYFLLIVIDFFAFFGSVIDTSVLSFRTNLRYSVTTVAGAIAWLTIAVPFVVFLCDFIFKPKKKARWVEFLTRKFSELPKVTLFVFSCFIFVSLSGLAFAVSRASLGIQEVYNSRYKAIPIFYYLVVYLAILLTVKPVIRTQFLKVVIVFTLIFHAYSYYLTWDDVYNFRKTKVLTQLNWDNNGRNYFYAFPDSRTPDDHVPVNEFQKLPIPPVEFTASIPGLMKYYNDALFLSRKYYGFYKTPESISEFSDLLYSESTPESPVSEEVEIAASENGFSVNVSNTFTPLFALNEGYYILFVNNEIRMSFPLNNEPNKLPQLIKTHQYYSRDISGGVGKNSLPSGNLEMRIVRVRNGNVAVLKRQNITI